MTEKQIRIISGLGAVAGSILALGNNITPLGLPGSVTQYWPIVYGLAFAFDRFMHAYIAPPK